TGVRGWYELQATDNNGRFEIGPVPPGTWRVTVRIRDYPDFTSEPRELGANANWDLGTITLARGGTARVHLLGPALEGLYLHVNNAARTGSWAVADETGGYPTSALAGGAYHPLVGGAGV